MVVNCAREYPSVFNIQMAATACLFNLSKAELSQQLHPSILRQIVEVYLYSISINSLIIFKVKQNSLYVQAGKFPER